MILEMRHSEKVTTGAAGVVFLCALIWAITSGTAEEVSSQSVSGSQSFTTESLELAVKPKAAEWGQPSSQGGPNWIFDIFTPPVIYYNEETGTFTVTPPFRDANQNNLPFELQLIEVRPVPYRFQLVSYAGAKGNYVLTLEDLQTGRDVFCAPNELLSEHNLEILNFTESRVIASSTREGTTEAFDLVGELFVKDTSTGEQHTLRHNQITYLDEPNAIFQTSSGATVPLAKGGVWNSSSSSYTILSIDPQQSSASVEKSSPDVGDKVVKVLHVSNNTSDLSNRNTRKSDPPPGAF